MGMFGCDTGVVPWGVFAPEIGGVGICMIGVTAGGGRVALLAGLYTVGESVTGGGPPGV